MSTLSIVELARPYLTRDLQLVDRAAACHRVLSEIEGAPAFSLLLLNQDVIPDESAYRILLTNSCKVVLDPPLILVSERFLQESEAAIRSFALATNLLDCTYLRSDAEMFSLAYRIRADARGIVTQLRPRTSSDIEEALYYSLLFFFAHELAHLIDEADNRSFAPNVARGAPLETQLSHAVTKLCRHVDDFVENGVGLPGWDVRAAKAETVIRGDANGGVSSSLEEEQIQQKYDRFFREETRADLTASHVLTQHIVSECGNSELSRMRAASLAVSGLFAIGITSWYRDLLTFSENLGLEDPLDANAMIVRMMQSRYSYIDAASLFGREHRFVLLRVVAAAESLIRVVSDYFDNPERTIWWERPNPALGAWWHYHRLDTSWWEKEAIQRQLLSTIMMDTASKMAHVGCSMPKLLEIDRRRATEQLTMITFESVDQAVARFRQFA